VIAALAPASGCGDDDPNGGSAAGERPAQPPSAEVVERLRDGGHVLALRHAATESAVDTTEDLTDCSRQRNLNAEGRAQSRAIGDAFRRLEIRVGRVLASPFCRARDTARLAFGRVRASRALLSAEFFASEEEARRRGMPRLLRARPARATNTVLVSHGSAIYAATGVNPDEGEVVIVEPGRGRRGFEVVGTVEADGWRAARQP
jgi:phosphohistidine phosphatase SixA